ncbi:unnamed protein product [Rotaria magnacalcarata]|uniref:Uncharacterized protein n=1 Tax=Rotaria magnacalcarata TaxID=392030 RepID=A0A818XEN9_9BILA|nr:unnamed protein product [Rotaria magnacalcarata]CAF3877544.1 unnamed protein product [Rotaria magnacalcarata]
MSRRSVNLCQDEISIRNDNIRFAFMFILFTLLSSLTTTVLLIFAHNSYHGKSQISQHRFIHYIILATISLFLFAIFFIGSLVYTSRSIRHVSVKLSSNLSMPLTSTLSKSSFSNETNDRTIIKTKNIFYDYNQTDV